MIHLGGYNCAVCTYTHAISYDTQIAQLWPPKWIITWSELGSNKDVNTSAEYVYYLVPLFQNEFSCKTFLMKMTFTDWHNNEPVGETHFHVNGFARRLGLTRRRKVTRKWSIPTGNFILSGERFYLEPNFSARITKISVNLRVVENSQNRKMKGILLALGRYPWWRVFESVPFSMIYLNFVSFGFWRPLHGVFLIWNMV